MKIRGKIGVWIVYQMYEILKRFERKQFSFFFFFLLGWLNLERK